MRIGLAGFHESAYALIRTLEETPGIDFVGVYTDLPLENAAFTALGYPVFDVFNALIMESDVVLCLQSGIEALQAAEKVIKFGKHVYLHRLDRMPEDYVAYLARLADEADVQTFINFDLLYHPVINRMREVPGDPQIIDISLGRTEGNTDRIPGDRYLASVALLVQQLSRRTEAPRLHAQTLHRAGGTDNPVQLRMEYIGNCLANVMLHGDAVPGHNRIRIYQNNGFTEADLDYGLVATQHYVDTEPKAAHALTDALVNTDNETRGNAGLCHFLRCLNGDASLAPVSFAVLREAARVAGMVRQKMQFAHVLMQ